MKTIGKITIILAAIFLISSIISILAGPINLFSGIEKIETTLTSHFEKTSAQEINLLKVDVSEADLNIYPVKGNEFLINLTMNYPSEYAEKVNISVKRNGETIEVKIIDPNRIFFINKYLRLDIGIPENYSKKIMISTASGDLSIKNINLENFETDTASGEIEIINLTSKENIKLISVSGDIDGENLISDNFKLVTSSGEIRANGLKSKNEITMDSISGDIYSEDIKSESFNVKTISGEIIMENISSKTNYFESVSGDINIISPDNLNTLKTRSGEVIIEKYFIQNNLDVETISGDVYIELIDESSVNLGFESVSGDLENYFGDIHSGKNKINVNTTSGELIISKS